MTHINDRVTYLQKIKFVSDSVQMTKINAKNWLVENVRRIDQNTIHYEIFDDEAKINFDIWKKYFDNVSYQRNNLEESCVNIDIQWNESIENTRFRIDEMLYEEVLHYWQFSTVNWLRQMKQKKNINDCIYANYMSLSKTWMMIVFCTTVSFICERFFIFLLQKSFRLFDCYFLDLVKDFHSWFVYYWRENLSQLLCLSLTRKFFTIFFTDHSIASQRTQ